MTREEQIVEFAKSLGYANGSFGYDLIAKTVKWADSHPAWVSVEDELPKERGKLYLVCDKYGRVGESAYDVEDDIWYRQSGMVLNPTHWMPLPQPPVKKGGQNDSNDK